MIKPTSILATKPFSSLKNPFLVGPKNPETNLDRNLHGVKFDPKGVGLSIIVHLTDPGDSKKKPQSNEFVLFGSQLKIQIPPQPGSSMEFGIKTRNSNLSPSSGLDTPDSPWISNGCLSDTEMVLSEDYTCVIARGEAVTKTTRIFEDCIVDSSFGESNTCTEGR